MYDELIALKYGDGPNEVDPEAFGWGYVKYESHRSLLIKASDHGRDSAYLEMMLADGTITEEGW